MISFSKYSKFYLDFENLTKLPENVDAFQDNCVWTCCGSFSQLWQEYMWWSANMLKSGRKISHPTKKHATRLNFCDINGTLAWKFFRDDLSSVLDPLTSWFQKGVLTQKFYGIQVTTFFGINNFGDIETMKLFFFRKCSKFYVHFENAIKLPQNAHGFGDNCVWTCCRSLCQLSQEYMSWAVKVLKSGYKISDTPKRKDAQLYLYYINGILA